MPERKTTLTKPAGCLLQVLGAGALLVGVGMLAGIGRGGSVWGVIVLAIGIWLLVVGRRPALR